MFERSVESIEISAHFAASSSVAEGVITRFAIRQEAAADHPTLRPHRLVVGTFDVVDGALVRRGRHELDVVGELTEVPALVGEAVPDLVLLNDEDLAYAKIRLDERSLETAVAHLAAMESLPRALVLSAAWDMTRDGEWSASRFADLVLATIEALAEDREEDEKIWGSMIKQALKRQRPGFNETYHGFRSFSQLLEEAQARRLIELEKDEKSGGYVVRAVAG